MFRFRSTTQNPDNANGTAPAGEPDGSAQLIGKGRPTPKRSQAEQARKRRMSPPRNRKEAAARQRQRTREQRVLQQQALKTGDERYLPARDRGRVRKFCRDFVDARRSVAEYLIPAFAGVMLLSFVPTPQTQSASTALLLVVVGLSLADAFRLARAVRRELQARFPNDDTRGAVGYALIRSSQFRRMRLPKPQVERGADV